MLELVAWMKDFTPGAAGVWTLVAMSAVAWWQGLPKLLASWEGRSAGIEARLQAAMKLTLDRYEEELRHFQERLTESDLKHKDCEDRAQRQNEKIYCLEQEILLLQRQLYEQNGGTTRYLNSSAKRATKAPS